MTANCLGQLDAGATVSEAAGRLMKGGKRMQSLLDDLVDFNRVSLGLGISIHRQPGDIGQLFAEEVVQLRAAHPGRNVELELKGTTDGLWDGPSLQRMLDNLVGNALKYGSQDAGVLVRVIGRDFDVVIEVHNQGSIGNTDTLEGLFDPLKRGLHEVSPEARDSSLGLGLYISCEVAKAHGGDISAQVQQDETVFVVHLPREA